MILATAEDLRSGRYVKREVLCGVVWSADPEGAPTSQQAVCGTMMQINKASGGVWSAALTSASRAATILLQRAERHKIDLGKNFLNEAPTYRPFVS